MRIAGAVLIVLGFLALAFGGINYRKTENVAEIGDFKMKVSERKQLPIPPLVSGVVILVGAGMLLGAGRKPQA
jgi:hypothetical protein